MEKISGDVGKESFDLVDPRRVGRCEVQVEPGVRLEPLGDRRGLVGAVVVAGQMNLKFVRNFDVNLGQELLELDRAVPTVDAGDHGPGTGIEVAVPVAVALLRPLRRQQRVDEHLQHLTQQIRARLGQRGHLPLPEVRGSPRAGGQGQYLVMRSSSCPSSSRFR